MIVKCITTQVKCTDAWNISIKYDRATANAWKSADYISEHDRRLRTIKYIYYIYIINIYYIIYMI